MFYLDDAGFEVCIYNYGLEYRGTFCLSNTLIFVYRMLPFSTHACERYERRCGRGCMEGQSLILMNHDMHLCLYLPVERALIQHVSAGYERVLEVYSVCLRHTLSL